MDPFLNPCGTVLEAAKRQGYLTGMVVTAKITDATPASFASHALDRSFENQIAEQLVGMGPPE
jgi:alkaline phosphatase